MEELFDYAPHMIKIQQGENKAHDLLLAKRYAEVLPILDEIVVHARMARAWVVHQLDEEANR